MKLWFDSIRSAIPLFDFMYVDWRSRFAQRLCVSLDAVSAQWLLLTNKYEMLSIRDLRFYLNICYAIFQVMRRQRGRVASHYHICFCVCEQLFRCSLTRNAKQLLNRRMEWHNGQSIKSNKNYCSVCPTFAVLITYFYDNNFFSLSLYSIFRLFSDALA